jgi:hypothetical protein
LQLHPGLRGFEIGDIHRMLDMNQFAVIPVNRAVGIFVIAAGDRVHLFPDNRLGRVLFQLDTGTKGARPDHIALQNLPANLSYKIAAAKGAPHFVADKKDFVGIKVGNINQGIQAVQDMFENIRIHAKSHFQN